MLIGRRSPLTGIVRVCDLDITEEQHRRWEQGELIQNAMPHLNPDEREFVMTGISPEEWEEIMQESSENE